MERAQSRGKRGLGDSSCCRTLSGLCKRRENQHKPFQKLLCRCTQRESVSTNPSRSFYVLPEASIVRILSKCEMGVRRSRPNTCGKIEDLGRRNTFVSGLGSQVLGRNEITSPRYCGHVCYIRVLSSSRDTFSITGPQEDFLPKACGKK